MRELVITNGASAADLIREAGIARDILPWRDILHEGPVPMTRDLATLSRVRARFLTAAGWSFGRDAAAELVDRDRWLLTAPQRERVALWFEHDLYDQLQLLQVLDALADMQLAAGRLWLLQSDHHLGRLSADAARALAAHARPVSALQLELARAAWRAFRMETPAAWAGLLGRPLEALPFLRAAVVRALEELPDPRSGLSRTERQVLGLLSRRVEQPTPPRLFRAGNDLEQAEYLGDWSFFAMLDRLAQCPQPLIEGLSGGPWTSLLAVGEAEWTSDSHWRARKVYLGSELRLSAFGRDVLDGRLNAVRYNPIDRWLGGTRVTSANLWCWDVARGALIAP